MAGIGAAPAWAQSKAKPPNLIANYTVLGVKCVPAAKETVRAEVRMRMTVVNDHGLRGRDGAPHMTLKARLIPTSAGLHITRPWRSWTPSYLTQNKRHSDGIRARTDNVSPAADWQVQIKAIWDRTAPIQDVVKETTRPFHGNCGGIGLPGVAAAGDDGRLTSPPDTSHQPRSSPLPPVPTSGA